MAEEFQPDVMLVDVLMPGIGGLRATQGIKERWPKIRVIVLSIASEFRHPALQSGAEAFLTKGDTPELLLATFEKVAHAETLPPSNPLPPGAGSRDSGTAQASS